MSKKDEYITINFGFGDFTKNSRKMNTKNKRNENQGIRHFILILSSIGTTILYFSLPGQYRILSFLLPVIALAYCFEKMRSTIIVLSFATVALFPTSIFTLDVGFSIENVINIVNTIDGTVTGLTGFAIIGLPTIGVIIIIGAVVTLQFDKILNMVIKVVISIVITITVSMIMNELGYSIFGDHLGELNDLYHRLVNELPGEISNNLPSLDFNSENFISYQFVNAFPLILGGICLAIPISSWIIGFKIPNPEFDILGKETELSRPNQPNYEFFIMLCVLLLGIFGFYLKTPVSEFINKGNLGYISIYSTVSITSCLLLGLGIGSISKIKLKYTIIGIIAGYFMLASFHNMFTPVTMDALNAYALEFENFTVYRIVATWLFVAPSESLLFHVLLPSLVIYFLMLPVKRANNEKINEEIELLKMNIDRLQTQSIYYQNSKMIKELGDNIENIERKQKRIFLLQKQKKEPILFTNKFMNKTKWAVFLSLSLLFQFIFASFHYFNSGLLFKTFWLSGLGIIYLISGCILEYIAIKYDWLACIIVHALNNSVVLILLLLI